MRKNILSAVCGSIITLGVLAEYNAPNQGNFIIVIAGFALLFVNVNID